MRRLLLALSLALAASSAPAAAEPPNTHEIIYRRPSGFWTSNQPASAGNEYKWRLLEIGIAVGLLTGVLLVRAIKRANKERGSRPLPPAWTNTQS